MEIEMRGEQAERSWAKAKCFHHFLGQCPLRMIGELTNFPLLNSYQIADVGDIQAIVASWFALESVVPASIAAPSTSTSVPNTDVSNLLLYDFQPSSLSFDESDNLRSTISNLGDNLRFREGFPRILRNM